MAWTKILLAGDSPTELKGTAYRTLFLDSAGDVTELAHGTSGQFLKSQGASADPIWDDPSVATLDVIGDVASITEAQGQVLFRSATAWDALDPGTSGYFLKTQGAAADPVWAAMSVAEDSIGATEINDQATDIQFKQIILEPVTTGTGTVEGTVFYDSDDDHLYVYVV